MRVNTWLRTTALAATGIIAAAAFSGCGSDDSATPDSFDEYTAIHSARLLNTSEARALPQLLESTSQPIDISLHASGVDRPVKLDDGALWLPAGMEMPQDCEGLYQGDLDTPAAEKSEHARFSRCLLEPGLIDFESYEHMVLLHRYLGVSAPEEDTFLDLLSGYINSVPHQHDHAHDNAHDDDNDQAASDGFLPFDSSDAWHCNGESTYTETCTCGFWKPVTMECTTTGSGEIGVTVGGGDKPGGSVTSGGGTTQCITYTWVTENSGTRTCTKNNYHPVVCWSTAEADTWYGRCACVDAISCGDCNCP